MIFQNKIEQYIEIIRELEKTFSEAKGREILPLSFFNSSIDILNRLKTGIYEIETMQLQIMQEHIKKAEKESGEENEINAINTINGIKETVEFIELKTLEEQPTPAVNILADTISRKINSDFGKSLSLNDRFMFQRDLFQGNANEMNQTFAQFNVYQSLNEVLDFLNNKYTIPWDSDSGIAFKELLDKRFA